MQLNPAHHLDHRLQEIDQQINTALRDIRRNLRELEKVSTDSATTPERPAPPKTGPAFAKVLQQTIDSGDDLG